MIIKCYNPITLECFEVITKASSVMWNKRFYGVGSFEIHLKETSVKELDIIKHNHNNGIVMKVIETFEETILYGYDLKGLTSFRYIKQPSTITDFSEGIIKSKATDCLATGDRAIENLVIATNQNRGTSITWSSENISLDDDLEKICLVDKIGYDITFDEAQFIFDVVIPEHKEDNIIFSRKFRNLENLEYNRDLFDTFNVVYSSDSGGTLVSLGNETGINRRESGTNKPEEMQNFLSDKGSVETLRGNANERLKYLVDWKLGDFVRIQNKDIYTVKQITEVKEAYEPSNQKFIPVFGEEKQSLIKRLKG